MTAILSALGAGVSAQQILRFIGSQSPSIANKIQSMLAAGLSAEKIVNFFTNKENFQQLKQEMSKQMMDPRQAENPLVLGQYIREGGRAQDMSSTIANNSISAGKTGLALGATALGSYALSRALPAIAGQFGAGNVPPVPPAPTTSPGGIPPGGAGPINPPPQGPAAGLFPVPGSPAPGGPGGQPPVAPPAPGMPGPSPNAQKHVDIIKQLGLEDHIRRQGHMTPQDIAATIEFTASPGQKKWIAEQTAAPLEQVVSDYLASAGAGQPQVSPIAQQANQPSPVEAQPGPAQPAPIEQQTPAETVTPQAKEKPNNKYTLNDDAVRNLLSSTPRGRDNVVEVGTLGDFFQGSELRNKFKDVLDIKVYKSGDDYVSADGRKAEGFFRSSGDKPGIYLTGAQGDLFELLTEEATHALRASKGRESSGKDVPYEEKVEEISAKKHVDYLKSLHHKEKEKINQEYIRQRLIDKGIDPDTMKKIETSKPVSKEVEKQVSALSGKNIGSIVSVGGLPGRIENIKKDIAKINVDGKIRHLKLKDVEEAPGDVKEAVIRLLQIPERDRSAITAYFGYDPIDKSLAVQYHNGNLYTYDNVDEEKIHKMANKLGIPITSGSNIFGEWEQGKQDSVGAALIAEILKDPMYAKENKNKTWRKYDTGYDYWEKLRNKPKPRAPSSKPKAKRPGKKPDDGS